MAAADSTSDIATRYATALFELARERDALDAVGRDLSALRGLIDESADLRELLRSPLLSREDQGKAITAVAERAGFNSLTQRFLGLLAQKRRLFATADIIRAFNRLLAAERGEVEAEVVSAVELKPGQLDAVREAIGEVAGGRVRLETRVDPELIGGLVVRIGSRMIDTSLRTKLRNLQFAMKGIG